MQEVREKILRAVTDDIAASKKRVERLKSSVTDKRLQFNRRVELNVELKSAVSALRSCRSKCFDIEDAAVEYIKELPMKDPLAWMSQKLGMPVETLAAQFSKTMQAIKKNMPTQAQIAEREKIKQAMASMSLDSEFCWF